MASYIHDVSASCCRFQKLYKKSVDRSNVDMLSNHCGILVSLRFAQKSIGSANSSLGSVTFLKKSIDPFKTLVVFRRSRHGASRG